MYPYIYISIKKHFTENIMPIYDINYNKYFEKFEFIRVLNIELIITINSIVEIVTTNNK